MRHIDAVVIGAGQAGLAVSRCLSDRRIGHVVLERGRVAQRWRSERWDSLRLLTPNWMTRLPGWSYRGPDPHGFMTAGEVVAFFEGYAQSCAAPLEEDTAVERMIAVDDGFVVDTTRGAWRAANVVIATGWCDRPAVPPIAALLDPAVVQLSAAAYRNPGALPAGGVLVVGASATGVQLADELAHAGRDVVLSVGSHTRLPRSHRGMDIYWWLERIGSLERRLEEVADPVAARREPSLQLTGRPDHRSVDLGTVQRRGVELTGRLMWAEGRRVRFAPDLARTMAAADARMRRILADIDRHIEASGLATEVLDGDRPSTVTADQRLEQLDLAERGITTVLWATGYRRSYPWLQAPVLDACGEIRQRRGCSGVPGLYVVGQRFQHRRNSHLIDGVGRDAVVVADHLARRTTSLSRA
jgi:putative flavoprotein involved in K+ transport